jgi:hypothetical protein
MYPLVSSLSIIIRFWLSYISIETLPIFSNEGLDWMLGQIISIYTVFRLICYPVVGIVASKMSIDSSSLKSIIYLILYTPLVLIYWVILLFLTHVIGVLPI